MLWMEHDDFFTTTRCAFELRDSPNIVDINNIPFITVKTSDFV